ncbi:TIGR02391 family protein [Catenulispora yoronensis]
MNREETYRQITEYWALVNASKAMPLMSSERRATVKRLNDEHLPRVNGIFKLLAPDLRPIRASTVNQHLAAKSTVDRALAILKRWELMASLQQMVGEPVLSMSMLDPVIGKVALPLWAAGKYRQAVNDAATHLNTFVQSRIGRDDISDKDLMAQAFSDKPRRRARRGCGARETRRMRLSGRSRRVRGHSPSAHSKPFATQPTT